MSLWCVTRGWLPTRGSVALSAVWFEQSAEILPVMGLTAIVKALERERAGWELNDGGIPNMVSIERAGLQLEDGSVVPDFFSRYCQPMPQDEVSGVQTTPIERLLG